MGSLNESFREIGDVNMGLKEEMKEMEKEIERIKSEFRDKEEELKKEILDLKKKRSEVDELLEQTNLKVGQRDNQIRKLLTENARYLQDSHDSLANLRKLQTSYERRNKSIIDKEQVIQRLTAENEEYKVFFNYELEKKRKEELKNDLNNQLKNLDQSKSNHSYINYEQ